MKSIFLTLLFIQLFSFQLFSQEIVMKGIVIDAESQQPVEFVNIGILNKNQGTVTNTEGEFSLIVPKQFETDSITISHINYRPVRILVKSFSNRTITLEPRTTQLREVVLSNKKRKTRKVGVKSYSRLLSMRVKSENNDILEVAQRINVSKKEVKVRAVNFAVRKWSKVDGVKVRINFYENINNVPQKKIVYKNIFAKIQAQEGSDWIRIDLDEKDVYIGQDFFVGIEFIPDFENPTIVDLGGILTKGKGYSRENSLGSWAKLNGGAAINAELAY